MRLRELTDKTGVYKKPTAKRENETGSNSPLTFQGDSKWENDKDFSHKWFSRPYLTNGPKGNYMLPIKNKKE